VTYATHSHASASLQPLSDQPIELPFAPGEIIGGKYEVGNLIGAGGMGFVVAARHIDLGESVALKFLRREALQHEELVMRFATEARAAVRIKSEYVAKVFDVGSLPDGVPFIVMEHLNGKDLCQLLHEQGQLPVRLTVEYVMQVCEALATAHATGIVHRDIKPENLFLTERGQGMNIVKVLDFGISKVALTGSAFDHVPMARTMMPMGSPVYMSPEQIRATDEIDARTDIWSLGCVLYELLTGVPAFDAPSLTALSATILEKDPVPMGQLAPDVPPELEAIVLRCLEKNREARFRNIAELAIALYPFGPRRARIFAERCASLLADSSNSQAELELPSIMPPANPTLRGVRTTATFKDGPTSTNSPTALIVVDPDEETPPFVPKKRRMWIGASLAVAALLGAYAGARQESSSDATPDRPVAAAARPMAPVAAAPVISAAAPLAPAVAPATTVSAAPSSTATSRPASTGARHPIAVAKPKHEAARTARGGDDLDVGF
jgi:serine/threonine-protein kinase